MIIVIYEPYHRSTWASNHPPMSQWKPSLRTCTTIIKIKMNQKIKITSTTHLQTTAAHSVDDGGIVHHGGFDASLLSPHV